MFRVFLAAPSADFLRSNTSHSASFSWRTVAAPPHLPAAVVPPDTYEAVSVRISHFYQNTIFHDDEAVDGDDTNVTFPSSDATQSASPSISRTQSFSFSCSNLDLSRSIAHFPSFQFNPNSLSSLSLLTRTPAKVNLLLAVMEVDGPDMVKIKKGQDAGKEVRILKMIVGDEEGRVGKLTAWREMAEVWGGGVEGAKRGDVVLIEGVNGSRDAQTSSSLTASPYLGSKLIICYRTLPRENEDHRFRPDLRLGASDAAVRKVAAVVKWFEGMAGL